MSKWEIFEKCSNLMADYKERFGTNVPMYVMFYSMEEICDIVEEALQNNNMIKSEE